MASLKHSHSAIRQNTYPVFSQNSKCSIRHFATPMRFGSRGPSDEVRPFPACSPRIRHQSELTEKALVSAVQGLGNKAS